MALRQRLGAVRGQQHRLAAEQIAGLRQVLVGMDHEQHAGREHGVVVEADVARPDRAEAEPVAAAANVRRVAVFAISLRFQHRVHGAADRRHRHAGHRRDGCRRSWRAPAARIFPLSSAHARAERDGAADLRELPAIARRDLRHQDVAGLHDPSVRGRHRGIARPGAEQQEIVLGAERLACTNAARPPARPRSSRACDLEHALHSRARRCGWPRAHWRSRRWSWLRRRRTRCRRRCSPAAVRPATRLAIVPARERQDRPGRPCRSHLRCRERGASPSTTSSAATMRRFGQHSAARSASQAGVTTRHGLAVGAQHHGGRPQRLEAARARSTGLGVSMKWLPSWTATSTSSLCSLMPARMAARRSSKVMARYRFKSRPTPRRRRDRYRRTAHRAAPSC